MSEDRFKKWRGRAPVPKPSSEYTLYKNKCKDCGADIHVSDKTCDVCTAINEGLRRIKNA